MHYIRYDILYTYVLARIQYWSYQAQMDEGRLLQKLLKAGDRERTASQKKQAAELNKAEKRKAELDRLFAKMYEDWAAGRITEYNFNMLSQRYQTEQQERAEKIEKLNADLVAQQQSAVDAEKWVNLIKQYVNPSELTAELLNALIEKIVVHEAVKDESNTRTQEIEIFHKFAYQIAFSVLPWRILHTVFRISRRPQTKPVMMLGSKDHSFQSRFFTSPYPLTTV